MAKHVVWITGARGFIGRHLARSFIDHANYVAGIGHGLWHEIDCSQWGISHWVNGDITVSNLNQLAKTTGLPDVIVHLAGGSTVGKSIDQPREDFFRTVVSTTELLEWLRVSSPDTAVVIASSAAVYGSNHEGQISETVALAPFSPYGHHKQMVEVLCKSYGNAYGLRTVIARIFSVYGPELKKQLLWDLCSRISQGETDLVLGGTGNEIRDWTAIGDVCRALKLLTHHTSSDAPIYNIGTGVGTCVSDIARIVTEKWFKCSGKSHDINLRFSGQSRIGDPFSLVANPSKIKELNFACEKQIHHGIDNYVSWYCSQMNIHT